MTTLAGNVTAVSMVWRTLGSVAEGSAVKPINLIFAIVQISVLTLLLGLSFSAIIAANAGRSAILWIVSVTVLVLSVAPLPLSTVLKAQIMSSRLVDTT